MTTKMLTLLGFGVNMLGVVIWGKILFDGYLQVIATFFIILNGVLAMSCLNWFLEEEYE